MDRNNNFTAFNRSMESICEVSADDIMGNDVDNVFSEHFPGWENGLKELFHEAKSSLDKVEGKNIPFSGQENELNLRSVTFYPVLDDSGSYDGMLCYVGKICEEGFREKGLLDERSLLKRKDDSSFRYDGIVIDINDRKKAEIFLMDERDRLDNRNPLCSLASLNVLMDERDHLEKISSGMGLGLAVISRDFRTIWANEVLRNLFGGVENRFCYEAYNKRSKVCDVCAVREVFDKGLDRVVREQHGFDRNGNQIWSEIIATPIRDTEGNITAAMQVVIPVTERKMRELELDENRARIESILRSAPVGIGVIKNGLFEDVNDRCSEIFGYSGEELTGRSLRSLFHIDDTYSDVEVALKSGIKENGVGTIDTRAKRKDGRIIDIEISATPIYSDNPSKAISFTVMDVTASKKHERKLKKYTQELEQLNHLKDLFSDIIRHDLLNPAGTIKGYTEILEDMEEDENKLHILKMIQNSNKRLIELIENASKYEKLNSIDEIDYFDNDLVSIFEGVVYDFKQALDEKDIKVNLFSGGPCIYAVNPLVSEVFANLLSNAIKYSPEGEKVDVAFYDSGNTCKVTISDHGDGIPDEDKLFVFDRFKRVDKKGVKGTGLGLAIVKRIMELHGGSYGVEDNPEGKGSVFWVTFTNSCL